MFPKVSGTCTASNTTSLGTQTLNFVTYQEDVLPNEWIPSWNANALDAGALAVKMYGWYHVLNPKWPQYNAAVDDTTDSQCYVPNSTQQSTTTAVEATSNNVIVNSSGDIFETSYLAGGTETGSSCSGTASQIPSTCINYIPNPSYVMRQNGTEWYAQNNGWSVNTMVSNYYSGNGGYVTGEWQPG